MPPFNSVKFTCIIIGCMFCFQFSIHAQLKVGFTADKAGGCAPLAISFKNTSTGLSSNAVFEWDFDNGNKSLLQNAGVILQKPKAYTVSLTVKDSGKSATIRQVITVYEKPVFNFSTSVQKGCMPLPVNFTVDTSGNKSALSGYFWDFGDGVTEAATGVQASHLYVAQQIPAVNLTVTNIHGCQANLLKQDVVKVLPPLVAAFSAAEKVLCKITDAAEFVNNSSGPGNLAYKWDFGDGGSSSRKDPSHVYSTKGTYPVKLAVNSSEGCSTEILQEAFINAADFNTTIAIAGLPVCRNNGIQLFFTSKAVADNATWDFGNGDTYYNWNGDTTAYYNYVTPGKFTVILTSNYGSCKEVVSKIIDVYEPPDLKGFLINKEGICGSPVNVSFADTTRSATAWEWYAGYPADFRSTEKAPSYHFSIDDIYNIHLTVTNAAGCKAYTNKIVDIRRPYVTIQSVDASPSGEVLSCGKLPLHFNATSSDPITNYQWDFDDGTTSTIAKPVHVFEKAGHYRVRLTYTTTNGCTGTVEMQNYVVRRDMVKADFTTSSTNICGNTPVTITNLSGNTVYYQWDLGNGYFQANTGQYNQLVHKFQEEGLYTIRLIATDGVCADTMIKPSYIKVSPPFPRITGYTNTCDGSRGEVTFNQTSTRVISGSWDFGDGSPAVPYQDQPQIKHLYKKTGWYKVVLTTTNGQCTVKDSISVTVLLKQHPILKADKSVVCSLDEDLKITFSNLEKSPIYSNYNGGYSPAGWYHNDGSFAPGANGVSMAENLGDTGFVMYVRNFTIGKQGLHCMVTSLFGCMDTTNSIPLSIKGPIPGFKINNKPCSNGNTVFFEDTSKAQNGVPLASWEWNFGDGPTETYNRGGEINRNYYYAQAYNVSLKVTDQSGCASVFYTTVDANASALRASFMASATTISPGTSVIFTNSSQTTDESNTSYKWILGDGTILTTKDAVKTFSIPGTYLVKLVASNVLKGCSDTASTSILVKFVNAAFSIDRSFISESKCPPVLARFASTSNNVSKLSWDFGDGTFVSDVYNPAHVYTKAGKYFVRLTTLSDNGTAYTTIDSVIIMEQSAEFSTDFLQSCTAQSITFKAVTKNVVAYLWDFGDGAIGQSNDAVAVHYYNNAGVYQPKLLVTDSLGCTVSVSLEKNIVIDSLFLSLSDVPKKICTPKEIVFVPAIVNIAASQSQQGLSYHWDFGTGYARDTSNVKTPSFLYDQPGTYPVTLKVQSQFGCKKEVTTSILALQGLGAKIDGPTQICQETTAQFTGSTILTGQAKWKWIFENGAIAEQQNPPAKMYDLPGNYLVTLVVDNGGCADTITRSLLVREKPKLLLSTKLATVCEGLPVNITATGGTTYAWSPSTAIDKPNQPDITATPVLNTIYTVTSKNSFGCVNTDSIMINVVHPFKLQLRSTAKLCQGNTMRLYASGAASYQWIKDTIGLSRTDIADPVATPITTSSFTVVGADSNKCFTDTASVYITVLPLPSVDAGPGLTINAGTSHSLRTIVSNDVVKWNWSPATFLNCSDCPSPVSNPTGPVTYTVTVSNSTGCTASDSVSINLLCSDSRIYIPLAFSPNNDGVNDQFSINGQGIRVVNHLAIYNRYGKVIFEKSNFQVGDRLASWDGRYKGEMVPAGAYVYVTTMSCNEKTFTKNGTVTVVY